MASWKEDETTRFLCDRMLGSLGKWLRILGFDVVIPPDVEDEKIDEMALDGGRILLTRDRRFSEKASSSNLLIRSLDVDTQLREVNEAYGVFGYSRENGMALTRCSVCNHPLEEVPKETVEGRVPERVYGEQDIFWACKGCGRYYWNGTHYGEMRKKIEKFI